MKSILILGGSYSAREKLLQILSNCIENRRAHIYDNVFSDIDYHSEVICIKKQINSVDEMCEAAMINSEINPVVCFVSDELKKSILISKSMSRRFLIINLDKHEN